MAFSPTELGGGGGGIMIVESNSTAAFSFLLLSSSPLGVLLVVVEPSNHSSRTRFSPIPNSDVLNPDENARGTADW